MKILLTNDDGFFAPGIKEFANQLIKKGHDIIIVAPDRENSGKSHSLTFMKDLVVKSEEIGLDCKCYSVSGTPVDCVRVAIEIFGREHFDYCMSGCNLGYNAGIDVLYSGTVSAAIEANIFGLNSIALSAEYNSENTNFSSAVKIAIEIFEKIGKKLNKSHILNINVPKLNTEELKGIKICSVGRPVLDKYSKEKTEEGYILKLSSRKILENPEFTDRFYLERGFATVSPLMYNLTNKDQIIDLEKFDFIG